VYDYISKKRKRKEKEVKMLESEPVTDQESAPEKKLKISRLLNSIQFYLECAFIVMEEEGCRLIILHSGKVFMDTHYNTERGAKIAFTKYFGQRAWQQDLKPIWSHTYYPDDQWMEQHLEIVQKGKGQLHMDNE
jgi:hypothetical protein